MWSTATNHAPGQQMGVAHSHASQMAHAAARKAAFAKSMGPAPVAPAAPPAAGPSPAPGLPFKAHVSALAATHGVSAGPAEIHGAIDALTHAGRFTPHQGAALKAHAGPLVGPQGQQTIGTIAQHVVGSAKGGV